MRNFLPSRLNGQYKSQSRECRPHQPTAPHLRPRPINPPPFASNASAQTTYQPRPYHPQNVVATHHLTLTEATAIVAIVDVAAVPHPQISTMSQTLTLLFENLSLTPSPTMRAPLTGNLSTVNPSIPIHRTYRLATKKTRSRPRSSA